MVMKTFVPSRRLPKNPALVVVLHGCRQTPESLDCKRSADNVRLEVPGHERFDFGCWPALSNAG
ncbi:hypothetical protein GFL15_34185, partial [Rhizobium leguminosarum bv. viciae]|nr:hypothetical protein [Rhizobium leguminosarum bv. viciae]